MKILAIDPGTYQSALVIVEFNHPQGLGPVGFKLHETNTLDNPKLLARLRDRQDMDNVNVMAIEQIKSYGNAMGDELLDTVMWSGRFIEAWRNSFKLLPRKSILRLLGLNGQSNDGNVRTGIYSRVDGWMPLNGRLGGNKPKRSIGLKDCPGPLYHVKRDEWQALAVAMAYFEDEENQRLALKRALI